MSRCRGVEWKRVRAGGVFLSALTLGGILGCREPSSTANLYESNHLFAHAMSVSQEVEMDQPISDTKALIADWFGTSDTPRIPPALKEGDFEDLFSEANLSLAANIEGKPGLYVQQCANCHGVSGQGRGGTAASQDPYPRDFRPGVFKFKSTLRGAKPLKEDIERTLRNGISGTQMPSFNKLSDNEIAALVDYVVFLSIRGEFERKLLQTAAIDSPDERLFDPTAEKSILDEQKSNAADALTQIAERWVQATDANEEFPLPDFPVFGQETESNKAELLASIEKGKELFGKEIAEIGRAHV